MLWHTAIIPVFENLRQEDHRFKFSLGYIARHLKKNKENKQEKSN